jgi:hypothetical protein
MNRAPDARNPDQPPPVSGPDAGAAKPAQPGPTEPPNIATSILPQRKADAARHPEGDADAPEQAGAETDPADGDD